MHDFKHATCKKESRVITELRITSVVVLSAQRFSCNHEVHWGEKFLLQVTIALVTVYRGNGRWYEPVLLQREIQQQPRGYWQSSGCPLEQVQQSP